MAISFPLAFPTHRGPVSVTIRPKSVTGVNVSPFSLVPQVYKWPGAERWEMDISFGPMSRANGEAWNAFILSLEGPVGSFTMGDPSGQTPRGTATSGVTATGSARATSITLAGSGTLLEGDWISFSSHRWLHKMKKSVTLSGGGVTAEIWPGLRAALSGAATATTAAKGRFMLLTESPEWSVDLAGHHHPPMLKAIEDLRP